MIGAILGDMVGAPYEFDRGSKTKDFEFWNRECMFTDDSVMTIAVAEALIAAGPDAGEKTIKEQVVKSMQDWGNRYPNAGYGGRFEGWLRDNNPKPYNSWGNGSAMRVSPAGWLYDSIDRTREVARWTAEVTHNHPEGVKGAEATATAVFMARNGASKDGIKDYIIREFGYDLSRTCDEIRSNYYHVESCQGTVPEAITAFLEGNDFEDVIRTAVSLGGDCDTLTCIAGGMAEAFYGIPEDMKVETCNRLKKDMLEVLNRFEEIVVQRQTPRFYDSFLDGNELIEGAITKYYDDSNKDNRIAVLEAIRSRMHDDGHFILPVITDENDEKSIVFRTIETKDRKVWHPAFTSQAEFEKGAPSRVISHFIDSIMKGTLETKAAGLIINPWGKSFMLSNELIEMIFNADGDEEYFVPDDTITEELLEDGSFLRRAIGICNRNRTKLNMIKLARVLRDSLVWVPGTAVFSEGDNDALDKIVQAAIEKNDLDSLVGHSFTSQDEVRMIPDILQSGDDYFFPVFVSDADMGEYGENFSKVQRHFLEAANLARNNEKQIKGIVINAFTENFIVPIEMFDIIAEMDSSIKGKVEAGG